MVDEYIFKIMNITLWVMDRSTDRELFVTYEQLTDLRLENSFFFFWTDP